MWYILTIGDLSKGCTISAAFQKDLNYLKWKFLKINCISENKTHELAKHERRNWNLRIARDSLSLTLSSWGVGALIWPGRRQSSVSGSFHHSTSSRALSHASWSLELGLGNPLETKAAAHLVAFSLVGHRVPHLCFCLCICITLCSLCTSHRLASRYT